MNDRGFSQSAPAVSRDGMIYWGVDDTFVAITTTGEIDWAWTNLSLDYSFGSSPAIGEDGSIYFTHDAVFSFSRDGVPRWVYPINAFTVQSAPAISLDGTIYIGSYNGLHAFAPNGRLKWTEPNGFNSPSIASDGTIYSGRSAGKLYAFNPDGTVKWVFTVVEPIGIPDTIAGPAALSSNGTILVGTICAGCEYAAVYAINPDGSQKWRYPVYRRHATDPSISAALLLDRDNNTFACSFNGSCYGLSPDGKQLWELEIKHNAWLLTSPLLIADGSMLVLDDAGMLYNLIEATDRVYLPLMSK